MAGTIPHAEERRRYGRGIGIRCHGAKNGVRREDVESERGGRTVLRIGRRPTDVEREFARVHEGVLRRSDVHGMAVERGGECVLVYFSFYCNFAPPSFTSFASRVCNASFRAMIESHVLFFL